MKYPSWREEGSAAPAEIAAENGRTIPAGAGWGLSLGLGRQPPPDQPNNNPRVNPYVPHWPLIDREASVLDPPETSRL